MSANQHTVIQCDGWRDFREAILGYAKISRARRNEWWFRGQGDSAWPLSTTLDRAVAGLGHVEFHKDLLREFRAEALRLGTPEQDLSEPVRLELLARHHGLPSPWMDWTLSPYVAAYFAFSGQERMASHVSVWCLDLAKVDWSQNEQVELLADDLPLSGNRRALQQRGVFLRVNENMPLDVLVPTGLRRYDIPVEDRDLALQDLDEMLVNATMMFYDLQGAAATARLRMEGAPNVSG